MDLVANSANGVYLRDIIDRIDESNNVEKVLAAVAYGKSFNTKQFELLNHCLKHNYRLDLWMRYDETVPVSIPLLIRLLESQKSNVFTKFVPDCFHSKVIWWKGYGAYIGSANLTEIAWTTNIEAGLFLTDDELVSNGMNIELDKFFDFVSTLDKSIPISQSYIDEMERLQKRKSAWQFDAKSLRGHPEWDGPEILDKATALEKNKEIFRQEWLETLGILQTIQTFMEEYRPVWIPEGTPAGWQVDQFLHAYYYKKVTEGRAKPYETFFLRNQKDPNGELKRQLEWWKATEKAPTIEDQMLTERAPTLQRLLSRENILSLTVKGFEMVCRNTHATSDHVVKIPLSELNRPDLASLDRDARFKLFSPIMMGMRNQKGWDIRQLLNYVMYQGPDENIWERLFLAGKDPIYRLPRYGLNSIAEVIGWVRPEIAPPRNGRTSKALRALGFDVKVY
ncbi:phospholipase D-like domain-containing protein [Neptuniibacter sp. QD48_55]|uniref:phospholipase D family protein n=1 Tax=Neptuniibacter sp. QD48_55 TaxID=3398212 RepID=UPI0039F582B5